MGEFDKGITALTYAGRDSGAGEEERNAALAMYYLGVIYRDKAEYATAMSCFEDAKDRFERQGARRLESFPLYDMAVLHLYRGNTDTAREYFSQIERLYRDIGYRSGLAAALGNLGVLAARRGDFDAAFDYGQQALSLAEDIGERLAVAYGKINLGIYHYMQSSHRTALSWLQAAREIITDIGARGYLGFVLSYTACAHAGLGEYEEALRNARDHFLEIRRTGSDVENGRTALAVAQTLANAELEGTGISETARAFLSEITDLAGTNTTADAFFRRAIEIAREAGYMQTLVPALAAYGTYLAERAGRAEGAERETARDAAGDVLAEAYEQAESAGMETDKARVAAAQEKLAEDEAQ
jgi:tetratricopeptide (TPR) repeat protein